MYTTTTLLTLTLSTLAALTTAAPSKTTNLKARQSSTPYEGISISVCVSPGLTPPAQKVYEPAPVELHVLGYCYGDNGTGCSVSSLTIDPGVIPNGVDLADVECRAYKDFAGIEPGSAPFTVNSPALISTNLATISSFLCYVVEASE